MPFNVTANYERWYGLTPSERQAMRRAAHRRRYSRLFGDESVGRVYSDWTRTEAGSVALGRYGNYRRPVEPNRSTPGAFRTRPRNAGQYSVSRHHDGGFSNRYSWARTASDARGPSGPYDYYGTHMPRSSGLQSTINPSAAFGGENRFSDITRAGQIEFNALEAEHNRRRGNRPSWAPIPASQFYGL